MKFTAVIFSPTIRAVVLGTVSAAAIISCSDDNTSRVPGAPTRANGGATAASVAVGVAGNASPSLAPGDHLQLWAVATYSDQTSADVTNTATWQSSNPSIATVTRDGVLTAAAEGAVDVSATVASVSGSIRATIRRRGCGASAVEPATVTFGPFAQTAWLSVTTTQSDCRWVARSDAGWIRFSTSGTTTYDPGRSGTGSANYLVQTNNYPDARVGHITIAFTDGSELIQTVSQEHPASCSYVVTPDEVHIPMAGGTGSFNVTTTPGDCQWRATTDYQFEGIRVTSNAAGVGAARVTYSVAPGTFDRIATIVVAGLSGANPAAVFTIHSP